ncbi:hypothetical protein LXL04_037982 [Taraxacum kok-saghyz]
MDYGRIEAQSEDHVDRNCELCNGTRLRVLVSGNRVIDACIIFGNNIGNRTFISRMSLTLMIKEFVPHLKEDNFHSIYRSRSVLSKGGVVFERSSVHSLTVIRVEAFCDGTLRKDENFDNPLIKRQHSLDLLKTHIFPRTSPISYISQTVIPFKKPTSGLFKTYLNAFETKS